MFNLVRFGSIAEVSRTQSTDRVRLPMQGLKLILPKPSHINRLEIFHGILPEGKQWSRNEIPF